MTEGAYEAECAVLGAIILDAPVCYSICQQKNVTPEHFVDSSNRVMFKALVGLATDIGPKYVDAVTVAGMIREQKLTDVVGGVNKVHALMDSCTTVAHTEFYIQKLQAVWLGEQVRLLNLGITDNLNSNMEPKAVLCDLVALATDLMHRDDSGLSFEERYERLRSGFQSAVGGGQALGYPSAWETCQNLLGGLMPVEMVVLSAKPSTGKTTLMCNELLHKGAMGVASGFVAIDTGANALINTLVACKADVSQFKLRVGRGTDEEVAKMDAASKDVAAMPIQVTDEVRSIEGIEAWATAQVARNDMKILVIDFFQLITGGEGSSQTERETDISGRLKALCKNLHINVWVLSQFHKTETSFGKSSRPTSEALRGSLMLAADADAVVLLYKDPEANFQNIAADGDWPIIYDVNKNRFGPTGRTKLNFVRSRQMFEVPFFDTISDAGYEMP